MLCVVSGITGRPQYPPPAPKHTGRAQGPLRTATRCRLIKAQGRRFFRQQSSARATFSREGENVDRRQPREAARGWNRGDAGVAPGSGETLAAERLHEDGGTARTARAGNRAPTAAGADEIVPAGCAVR